MKPPESQLLDARIMASLWVLNQSGTGNAHPKAHPNARQTRSKQMNQLPISSSRWISFSRTRIFLALAQVVTALPHLSTAHCLALRTKHRLRHWLWLWLCCCRSRSSSSSIGSSSTTSSIRSRFKSTSSGMLRFSVTYEFPVYQVAFLI